MQVNTEYVAHMPKNVVWTYMKIHIENLKPNANLTYYLNTTLQK